MGVTTPFPSPDAIARAERLTRERFVYEGETLEDALAPGSPRRRALDAALAEVDAGQPSSRRSQWRREFSLLLGLERMLSEEEPHLVDGTVLSAHQVDALSGTLTALLAEAQRQPTATAPPPARDGRSSRSSRTPDDEPDGAAGAPARSRSHAARRRATRRTRTRTTPSTRCPRTRTRRRGSDEDAASRSPRTRSRRTGSDEADEEEPQLDEQPEDPNAAKRFWFEHATGAGKTVAALGFVEASRTGGVLILTHRRNLVDQFHGELRDRGYRDRITGALLDGAGRRQRPGHRRDLPVVRAQRRAHL